VLGPGPPPLSPVFPGMQLLHGPPGVGPPPMQPPGFGLVATASLVPGKGAGKGPGKPFGDDGPVIPPSGPFDFKDILPSWAKNLMGEDSIVPMDGIL
jgi:hypothetical protein